MSYNKNKIDFKQAYLIGLLTQMNDFSFVGKSEDEILCLTGVYLEEIVLVDETDKYWVIVYKGDGHSDIMLNIVFKPEDGSLDDGLEMFSCPLDPDLIEYPEIVEWLGGSFKKLSQALKQ